MEHFLAFSEGRKITVPTLDDITNAAVDATWIALTNEPFSPEQLRIADLPMKHRPVAKAARLTAQPLVQAPVQGRGNRRKAVLEEV